jgi:hypothetical protein
VIVAVRCPAEVDSVAGDVADAASPVDLTTVQIKIDDAVAHVTGDDNYIIELIFVTTGGRLVDRYPTNALLAVNDLPIRGSLSGRDIGASVGGQSVGDRACFHRDTTGNPGKDSFANPRGRVEGCLEGNTSNSQRECSRDEVCT